MDAEPMTPDPASPGPTGPAPASPGPTCVAVVDDHPLFRRGITSLLETLEGIRVVGDAGSLESALALVEATRPDVC